jgi:tetratricopeptide (TPR) repeat protein
MGGALRWGVVVGAAMLGPVEARAQEVAAPEPALELHDEARRHYAEGRYREAVKKLEEAVAIDPQAKLLHYNLGLIYEKIGELDAALASYRRTLALETAPNERALLERTIARLEGAKRHLRFGPEVPAPAPPPPPAPPPGDEPGVLRPWIYAGGAVAAAGLLGAAALAIAAATTQPGPGATTGEGVSISDLESDAETAHGLAIAADVSLGVGVAGVITTVALLLASDAEGAGSARAGRARAAFHRGAAPGVRFAW